MATTRAKKYLALDVGEVRIGLAIGEEGSSFVFGRGYITRATRTKTSKTTKLAEDIALIKEKVLDCSADIVVLGLPLRQDGEDSQQTKNVREFAKALQQAFEIDNDVDGVEIVFQDERYSSKVAEQHLRSSGLSKKNRREKGLVDEAAAKLILESYLKIEPLF